MSYQPPRGTRDIFGLEKYAHDHLKREADALANLYGYRYIETPIFEHTNVFQRTLGETSDMASKEMYTFQDRGGDNLTLRPEGTAPVVRAMISLGLTQTLPQKLMYYGPMFRYERPQKGRFRQFYQLGVECLGVAHPLVDVECIDLAYRILQAVKVEASVCINTLGDQESRLRYRAALVEYFDAYRADLSEESQVRLIKNPLRILDSKNLKDQEICASAPMIGDFLNDTSRLFFDSVLQGLTNINLPYTVDPKLVRGMDYYCHTAFEFKTTALGAQDAIGGGGRYDGLMKQMGGPETPGIGWGLGVDRIAMLMQETMQQAPRMRIAILPIGEHLDHDALKLAGCLRDNGISCELTYTGNMGKRFKFAEKRACTHALIFGDDELSKGVINLKFLLATEEKEKTIPRHELIETLLAL